MSLRRLRESLSHLERLERQRQTLRDRFESYPGGTEKGLEGKYRAQLSPRRRSESPPPRGRSGTGGLSFVTPSREPVTSTEDLAKAYQSDEASPRIVRPEPSASRDSALALALERSQDHIEALQRERDEALRRAADQESEVLRLTMLVERSEAGHCALLEERQRELSELQRLRREHREAREQTAALRAEVQQTKSAADETRQRLEKMLTEQREHMEALEESAGLAERELQDRSMQSADMEIALFSCLQERTSLLQFMVDLLSALQTLFYDPTPFTRLRLRSASPPPGAAGRRRSTSREPTHRHLHSGCYACASQCDLAPLPSAQAMKDIGTTISGGDDLRELCTALEAEIAQASQAFSAQVQRVLAEAEQSARAIGSAAPGQSLRACGLWVEQEKRRKEKQGLPSDRAVPSVDWAEERAQYLATTRAMEAKFAQLTKLRRLLQAKYTAARRKIHAGRY